MEKNRIGLFKKVLSGDHRGRKRTLIVAIGLVLLVVIVLTFLLVTAMQKSSPGGTEVSNATEYRDWLKPSKEIKIGGERYMSPCQVLNIDDVTDVFGKLKADESVSEEYIDMSVPSDTLPYMTRCAYGDSISLDAEQYTNVDRIGRLDSSVYSLGEDDLDAKLAVFEKAANASSDTAVKDFVAKLKSSSAVYKAYTKAGYRSEALARAKTDGLIIPVGYDTFSFNVIQGSVVYRLELSSGLDSEQELALPAKDMGNVLAQMKAITDRMLAHAKDKNLSQSPAPTILGSTNKNKQTRILEPCAVLSPQVFKAITAIDYNEATKRTSVPMDVEKERIAKKDKIQIFPSNSCERSNRALGTGTASSSIAVDLELKYADSNASLQRALDAGYKLGPNDSMLTTDADWAVMFVVDSYEPYYMFRVGTYVGIVGIKTISSGGLGTDIVQGQASREQHVDAINKVVASLKSNLKTAQKD